MYKYYRSVYLMLLFIILLIIVLTSLAMADDMVVDVEYDRKQYQVFYVRQDGGTILQCNGLYDVPYHHSIDNGKCAVNHPFWLLPPSGKQDNNRRPILQGGDTMIIGPGHYMIGYGAPNTINETPVCKSSWAYDCSMPALPSGPDKAHPTRILGANWESKVTQRPQLYGVERVPQIINLNGSSNIEIRYLDLTDHNSCIHNSPDDAKRCNRSTFPRGEHADYGIRASDSRNVMLNDLIIHGLSVGGIKAGRLHDWTLKNVVIRGNGFVGWDGDIGAGKSSNSGIIKFIDSKIEFSGCGERYPSGEIYGCYSQSQGGYGDGLGTHKTGGTWIFENVEISHNTSDGLDLLYHDGNGKIIIKRSRFEGNAGNAVKVATDAQVENSVIISNCDYFWGNPQAEQGGVQEGYRNSRSFDSCRAGGTALMTAGWKPGRAVTVANSLITGTSTILIEAKGDGCDGSERFVSRNNIFVGMEGWFKKTHGEPRLSSVLFYLDGDDGNGRGTCGTGPARIQFGNQDSIVFNMRNYVCDRRKNVLCLDPKLTGLPPLMNAKPIYQYGEAWDIRPSKRSPVYGRRSTLPGHPLLDGVTVPEVDILGIPRSKDSVIWGPYQFPGSE